MRRSILALTLLFLVPSSGTGGAVPAMEEPPAWPDTRAAVVARAYLEALNSSDESTLIRFNQTFRAPDDTDPAARAQRSLAVHAQLGALTMTAVRTSEQRRLVILAKASAVPVPLQLTFVLGSQTPALLESVEIGPAPPATGDDDWARGPFTSLPELLTRAREANGVPAIVMVVVENGAVVHEAAVGVRAAGREDRVTLDDPFHIGSVTKSMTALLVGRLIDQGALDWTQTLEQIFPDIEMHEAYRNVTVEQLMQHRSGMPMMLADDAAAPGSPRVEFIKRALNAAPVAPANDRSVYSNVGYGVLGAIAERVTGSSWQKLMARYVFDPLALRQSGFGWPDATEPSGHERKGDQFVPAQSNDEALATYLAPAGNVHCSVRDLARYGAAMLEGLSTHATIKRLHTPMHPDRDDRPYASGWMLRDFGTPRVVHWHAGTAGTFYAHLELDPARGRVSAVAMNVGLEGMSVAERLVQAVP